MLEKLRANPLLASLLVLLLYAGFFVLPGYLVEPDPDQHGVSGIDGAIAMWPLQLILGIAFIIILTALGWWEKIGFRRINPGGLKFLLPPLLLAAFILFIADMKDDTGHWFLAFDNVQQLLALALVMLGLGFTEETMFRGILFHGLETRFRPLATVLGSAVIFGLFHFVNLFVGAGFYDTSYQVMHAAAAGFMYATLRLRIGAIWPVMIFHGFWDSSLFISQTVNATGGEAEAATSFNLGFALMIMIPAVLYGVFVYWRWSVWNSARAGDDTV